MDLPDCMEVLSLLAAEIATETGMEVQVIYELLITILAEIESD
jgi:hypothetical protein